MNDKIALVSCSGLSPLGLVVRAATVELALDNENIVAACITEYSAQPNQCSPILEDAKVVSITGCTDDCVSTILKEKDVDIVKNIDAESIVKENDLNPNDSVRLDDDGEKAVKALKDYILKELGKVLGQTDADSQVNEIEVTESFLNMQIEKAEEARKKNQKMYKTLGVVVGLVFVIILI